MNLLACSSWLYAIVFWLDAEQVFVITDGGLKYLASLGGDDPHYSLVPLPTAGTA